MRIRSLLVLLALSAVGCGSADSLAPGGGGTPPPGTLVGFQARAVIDGGTTYPFQVFIPAAYDKTKKWPVILFLHGSTDRGNDNQAQLRNGLGPVVIAQASTFPAIVVFPQMAGGESVGRIAYTRTAVASLDSVLKEFSGADPTRVYLTGVSSGGIAAFEIAYKNPTKFAAFAPISANICGFCIFGTPIPTVQQSATTLAQTLSRLPVWQFQGTDDLSVPVADVRVITSIFKSVNPLDQYTEFAGMDHVIWDKVYATPSFWTWLYAQHR